MPPPVAAADEEVTFFVVLPAELTLLELVVLLPEVPVADLLLELVTPLTPSDRVVFVLLAVLVAPEEEVVAILAPWSMLLEVVCCVLVVVG